MCRPMIIFLKFDVTRVFTPPPSVTDRHTFLDPFPLERDKLSGRPQGRQLVGIIFNTSSLRHLLDLIPTRGSIVSQAAPSNPRLYIPVSDVDEGTDPSQFALVRGR